ncbi:MAG: ABC transporter permease subunit [Spirulinaceae cyanobacterium SM2_1_0]|nr:ABC transporter permease subunit [Spirulinaceae cyanobacterium SM2_1_0]
MVITLANIIAIFRKELHFYFASPLAYLIAGVFWLLSGFFFVIVLNSNIDQAFQFDNSGLPPQPLDVAYLFLLEFLSVMGLVSLFVLPVLSMGLYAEERKHRTLELLATSPMTNWVVALGKLLGVVTFFTTMVLPLLVCELIAFGAANPPVPLAVPILGHLGLILMAAAILSLGMFISSLTDSSLLAALMTFVLVVMIWVSDLLAGRLGQPFGDILAHISLIRHYNNFVQGIFDTSGLILFASYIILGLFLTAQSIEALRFQRS